MNHLGCFITHYFLNTFINTVHYALSTAILIYQLCPLMNKSCENHALSPEVQCGPGCPLMTSPQSCLAGPAGLFLHRLLHQEL